MGVNLYTCETCCDVEKCVPRAIADTKCLVIPSSMSVSSLSRYLDDDEDFEESTTFVYSPETVNDKNMILHPKQWRALRLFLRLGLMDKLCVRDMKITDIPLHYLLNNPAPMNKKLWIVFKSCWSPVVVVLDSERQIFVRKIWDKNTTTTTTTTEKKKSQTFVLREVISETNRTGDVQTLMKLARDVTLKTSPDFETYYKNYEEDGMSTFLRCLSGEDFIHDLSNRDILQFVVSVLKKSGSDDIFHVYDCALVFPKSHDVERRLPKTENVLDLSHETACCIVKLGEKVPYFLCTTSGWYPRRSNDDQCKHLSPYWVKTCEDIRDAEGEDSVSPECGWNVGSCFHLSDSSPFVNVFIERVYKGGKWVSKDNLEDVSRRGEGEVLASTFYKFYQLLWGDQRLIFCDANDYHMEESTDTVREEKPKNYFSPYEGITTCNVTVKTTPMDTRNLCEKLHDFTRPDSESDIILPATKKRSMRMCSLYTALVHGESAISKNSIIQCGLTQLCTDL